MEACSRLLWMGIYMHTNCVPVLQQTLAACPYLFAIDLAASFLVFIDVHIVMN